MVSANVVCSLGTNITLCLVAAFLCGAGCSKDQSGGAANKAESSEASKESESRVKRGTNGEVTVTLDAATQKTMGLQTAPLEATSLPLEVKGYGRVMDTSPLASVVAELATSEAANKASQAELERLKTLAAQSNASERAVQAAQAAASRDRAQVESIRSRLLASWGSVIAGRSDLPTFAQSLISQQAVVVEVDLPAGQTIKGQPNGARLSTLDPESPPVAAQFIGPAPAVDPQTQGQGFLFQVAPNTSHLVPGQNLSARLEMPGEPRPGVTVPRSAVVRYKGAVWVYKQSGEDAFQRLEVSLEAPLTEGWFVSQGLQPQDKLVIAGAQALLSEEVKGED